MKRGRGLLVLFVVCAIIGSVYANWLFAGNETTDSEQKMGFGLMPVDGSAPSGTISIALPSGGTVSGPDGSPGGILPQGGFRIMLDQRAEGDYRAKVVITDDPKDGSPAVELTDDVNNITVSFTPGAGAPVSIVQDGIVMQYKLVRPDVSFTKKEGDTVTEGVPVFTKPSAPADSAGGWLDANDGLAARSFELTPSQIRDLIAVDPAFTLPTKADYDVFNASIGTGEEAKTFSLLVRQKPDTEEP